jgi:RimJ/RimL family protein N-acetyltransferase
MADYAPQRITLRDGAAVELTSAVEADAEELLEYLDRVRRETDFLMWGPADPLFGVEQERQWVRSQVDSPDAVLIAARAAGRIVALAGAAGGGMFRRSAHRAEVGISVLADWCGRGLGTVLMRELVDWARRHPTFTVLRLGVYAQNARAIAVYERTGFTAEGRRRWAIRLEDGRYVDEVVMSQWVGEGEPPA